MGGILIGRSFDFMVTLTDAEGGEVNAYFFRDIRNAEEFFDSKVTQYSAAPLFKKTIEFFERVDYPASWKRVRFF